MKAEASTPLEFQKKIEVIEQALLKLKKSNFGFPKKNISLKGILKGAKITEKQINQAKKSLFKFV